MMHGPEKSDLAIVAGKPANKAEQSAAESVERRAGAKGNAGQQSTFRTQSRANVSQALERIRQALAVTHPRWEPYAGKPPVRFCAGGVRCNARPYRYATVLLAQADRGCHAALSRSIALRVVIIFRMTATMMTLDFLSASARRLWKALRAGLYRLALRAAM